MNNQLSISPTLTHTDTHHLETHAPRTHTDLETHAQSTHTHKLTHLDGERDLHIARSNSSSGTQAPQHTHILTLNTL